MFTGIIKAEGAVLETKKAEGNLLVKVAVPLAWTCKTGESMAVNGVCSTVKKAEKGKVTFDYMPETLRKTTALFWKKGEMLNLEQSIKADAAFDGHLVMGHVDEVGLFAATVKDGKSRLMKINVSRDTALLLALKGSVSLDGVSLTLTDVGDDWFAVALIPYTYEHTNLRYRKVGDKMNVEADIISKYLKRQMDERMSKGKAGR